MATVKGTVVAVGTVTYAGSTFIAPHGAPYRYGTKNANVVLLLLHFGFLTPDMCTAAYGGNSPSNFYRWLTNSGGNVATPAQRFAQNDKLALADGQPYGAGKGNNTLTLAKPYPIAWLTPANLAGNPLLLAGYNAGIAVQKAMQAATASKPKPATARKGNGKATGMAQGHTGQAQADGQTEGQTEGQ